MKNRVHVLFIGILFLTGCIIQTNGTTSREDTSADNQIVQVSGIAQETKDGFYVGDFVLTYENLAAFDANYRFDDYNNKQLEITAKIKEVEIPCESPSGVITQCRQGPAKYIYDIESMKVVD